jgi:hypothetical protein
MWSWAFKHPTPDDFFRTMENVAGEDLSWSGEVGFNTIGVLTKGLMQLNT